MQKCIRSLVLELNTVLELVHKFRAQSLFTGGGGGGGPENFGENHMVFRGREGDHSSPTGHKRRTLEN